MSEGIGSDVLDALPSQPISAETVRKIGESDAFVGTRPIESRFNDIITEFVLYNDKKAYAFGYDPEIEAWNLLQSRSYDKESMYEVEEILMDELYGWRNEFVLPFLVENDLIPSFEIE